MTEINLNSQIFQKNPVINKTQKVYERQQLSFGHKDEFCSSKSDEQREKPSLMNKLRGNVAALLLSATAAGLSGYNTIHQRTLEQSFQKQQAGQTELTGQINESNIHQRNLEEALWEQQMKQTELTRQINKDIKPYTLNALEQVAKKASRSTVVINIFENKKQDESKNNEGEEGDEIVSSMGSGFIIAPDMILTNTHVVNIKDFVGFLEIPNSENSVMFTKENIIAMDPEYDLAVIKLPKGTKLPKTAVPLHLSNEEPVQGETVAAMGAPLNFNNTFTTGVISNIDRVIEDSPKLKLLQTDAAINQGSSGGPLINLKGEVIGVNEAVYGREVLAEGLNLSIKASAVREFLKEHNIKLDN